MDEEDRHAAGMRRRRAVLGEAYVDTAVAKATPFTAEFQDLITRYAWGEIWTREALDDETRRMLTIAMLVALGRDHELRLHVWAALDHGMSPDRLKEVLLQCAIYCGVPAANAAFQIASEVLAERTT
jgi:4-carboxymuconolactone decarboxylase